MVRFLKGSDDDVGPTGTSENPSGNDMLPCLFSDALMTGVNGPHSQSDRSLGSIEPLASRTHENFCMLFTSCRIAARKESGCVLLSGV